MDWKYFKPEGKGMLAYLDDDSRLMVACGLPQECHDYECNSRAGRGYQTL